MKLVPAKRMSSTVLYFVSNKQHGTNNKCSICQKRSGGDHLKKNQHCYSDKPINIWMTSTLFYSFDRKEHV